MAAVDIYVDTDLGDDGNGGLSFGDAFATLNKALSEADVQGGAGDDVTIHVHGDADDTTEATISTADFDTLTIQPYEAGDYNDGVFGGGYTLHVNPTTNSACLNLEDSTPNYTIIGIHIKLNASCSTSDECVEVGVRTTVLFQRCIFEGVGSTAQTDGVYWDHTIVPTSGAELDITFENCVFHDFSRAGIHNQYYATSSSHSTTVNVYYCTFISPNSADNLGHAIRVQTYESGQTVTTDAHNCYAKNELTTVDAYFSTGSGTETWTGDHNLTSDDDSAVGRFGAGNGNLDSVELTDDPTETTADSYFLVNDITGDDFDLDDFTSGETNDAIEGGTPVTGITVDIAGRSRDGTSPDVGAFEHQAAAAGQPMHKRGFGIPGMRQSRPRVFH